MNKGETLNWKVVYEGKTERRKCNVKLRNIINHQKII